LFAQGTLETLPRTLCLDALALLMNAAPELAMSRAPSARHQQPSYPAPH
jgi:hypothetical protein